MNFQAHAVDMPTNSLAVHLLLLKRFLFGAAAKRKWRGISMAIVYEYEVLTTL